MTSLQQTVSAKKAALEKTLEGTLGKLAAACAHAWPDAEALDACFERFIGELPHCHLLYALTKKGLQISSNVTPKEIDPLWRGQDLSMRPHHTCPLPYRGLLLSPVYLSRISLKPCITAIHAVERDDKLQGFICADFNLCDVPEFSARDEDRLSARQYKGDPAIRGTVFMQARTRSFMDEHQDEWVRSMHRLMTEHGVFHCILHFSSARAVLWLYDDPYNYRLNSIDEIIDPEILIAYPAQSYPARAKVTPEQVREVLEYFRALREADENIYLRSASLNIMNARIGLTFSCDGSHYLPVDEFLGKQLSYWI